MTVPSANEHVVAVFRDKREDNPYVVAPSRLIVENGDTIHFHNTDIDDVEVIVKFDNGNNGKRFAKDFLLPVGTVESRQVGDLGNYPYEVLCGGQEAQGSRPIIIVYK